MAEVEASWGDINNNGTCKTGGAGLNVNDGAHLGAGRNDAYDGGLCMFVDANPFVGPNTVDQTSTTVTSGPTSMSGLNVTYQYAFLSSGPIVRALASFQNPTGAPITVTVTFDSNLGSDGGTQIVGSSSGDLLATIADRWAITSDHASDPPTDTPIIHVIAGPGTPAVTPSVLGAPTAFDGPGCATNTGSADGVCVAYSLTVPANSTRRLMLFDELTGTIASGQGTAPTYNTNPAISDGKIADLTTQQLLEIVNWDLAGIIPTATPTSTLTPTATATATATSTSTVPSTATPTSTVVPVACSPRPAVSVNAVASGGGRLQVTVSTSGAPATPDNRLTRLRATIPSNAVVDLSGGAQGLTGDQDLPIPAGAQSLSFVVRRTGPGGIQVPLTIVDTCGTWPSFVGGGPNAF